MKIMMSNGQVSVSMTQYEKGGMVDYVITRGGYIDTFVITKEEANQKYALLKNQGFKVIPEKEVKEEKAAAAPKEPKPKKTREERLTEKYGDKESRKAFVEARKAVRRALLLQGYHYGKDFDLAVKDAMAEWEAMGRPVLN